MREATAFYQQAVGAELLYKITFGEMPKDENSEEGCPSGMNFPDTAIAHSNVRIAGSDIMMSDGYRPAAARNTRVSHWCSTPVMCRKASAGSTTSPMAAILKWRRETFWAHGFGTVTDKYGVPWMINVVKS